VFRTDGGAKNLTIITEEFKIKLKLTAQGKQEAQ